MTTAWLVWLGLLVALEGTAKLLHQPTLSSKVWSWFSMEEKKTWWAFRRVVFVFFWMSLLSHFVWELPAMWTVILPGMPFAAVIAYSSLCEGREEESVEKFSWWKSVLKGLWSIIVAGIGSVAAVFLANVLDKLDTQAEWTVLGAPVWLAVAMVFVIGVLRNYLKQNLWKGR